MNTEHILQQLRDQRDRVARAIEALEGGSGMGRPAFGKKRPRGISAAGRKRLSEMMKARWAARRRARAGKTARSRSAKK